MISRITGRVIQTGDDHVCVEVNGLCYEVQVPSGVALRLKESAGGDSTITLHTIHYIEGGMAIGNVTPRLIGFLDPNDREFFDLLRTVKGFGMRKALGALVIPIKRIATAIEKEDPRSLAKLPGIGARMAEKIIAELDATMEHS